MTGPLSAKGTVFGTRITNTAEVEFNGLINSTTMSTQVMAIYGMVTDLTQNGATNSVPPAGTASFFYIVSNNGNSDMDVIVTLSNFNMVSGSNWQAWLSLDTSQTMQGIIPPLIITNNLPIGAVSIFTLYVRTDNNSAPNDMGNIPIIIEASSTNPGAISAGYLGDNAEGYGAYNSTNYNRLYPVVNIAAPYIVLRKSLSVLNTPTYLANGGTPGIPVPDSVITYTNFYDNDGNAEAINLVILDRIPYHTDFILGSIVNNLHIGGSATISYRDRNGAAYTPAVLPGEADPNIGQIVFTFSGASVGADNGDAGDTVGVADGASQDDDAGYFYYKVVVHRRRSN